MRISDLINKKKLGQSLSKEEIQYIIASYMDGSTPDYQISALLMAIYFKGMNAAEISDLTMAMVESGEVIDLSGISGVKVDKHSTGGVGDKVSLIVAPIVAAYGVPVAKMSGRGLGHTGGTVDKLESIEGFKIELTQDEFVAAVNKIKIAVVGQSGNLAPADKKLYALRDVTGTVDSIPLIASSIMSKKIASGADAIVLDVKFGNGAFMKTIEEARALAQTMVDIGNNLNRKTIAVLTDMNQPLGNEIGNANEIKESIAVLKGEGPQDLVEVSYAIAAHMLVLGGAFASYDEALKGVDEVVKSGKALESMRQFISSQGGNPDVVDNPDLLPEAKYTQSITSNKTGYITAINAEKIGTAAMIIGAGRAKKEDAIDHSVGLRLLKKVGDKVEQGEVLCLVNSNTQDITATESLIHEAYVVESDKPASSDHIFGVIS
ncbi:MULTISPECIES: pyrimidine-nucleoside phosphorylase [Paenibacillus]|uniref:pyrimidine-nucleoside phosphorylase n=1 Tax=Paenibacillus TaxID=44249 RepID=UPI0022B8D744|nr:pyrimidine-nucleoside phosphorylase [Paenibacillus caseinilyticus]MCZ8521954.1 pyrimidine-nucleoside phosphorylase [Paenibacillus caseinilyticus]